MRKLTDKGPSLGGCSDSQRRECRFVQGRLRWQTEILSVWRRSTRRFVHAIVDGLEGYAQADVGGTMVSLHLEGGWNTKLYHAPMDGIKAHDILQEMIIDVASDEGYATNRTFRRSFAQWMIDDRRAYPSSTWPKKHADADRIEMLLANRRRPCSSSCGSNSNVGRELQRSYMNQDFYFEERTLSIVTASNFLGACLLIITALLSIWSLRVRLGSRVFPWAGMANWPIRWNNLARSGRTLSSIQFRDAVRGQYEKSVDVAVRLRQEKI